MKNRLTLGCVLLAAGNARRFGGNKLTASLDGRSLIVRALEVIPIEDLESVVVVTQYPEIMRLGKEFHFAAIHNAHPELGLSHSLQMGLTALRDCDGILFLVADQPLLQRTSVASLISLWRKQPEKIAALAHNGVRGNPCIFPSRLFHELMSLVGDTGGSAVIRRHEQDVILLEADAQELADVDTVSTLEDLHTMMKTDRQP